MHQTDISGRVQGYVDTPAEPINPALLVAAILGLTGPVAVALVWLIAKATPGLAYMLGLLLA